MTTGRQFVAFVTVVADWAALPFVVLHGTASPPVPHWLVLLVAVLGLWVVIGLGVRVGDRLLERV